MRVLTVPVECCCVVDLRWAWDIPLESSSDGWSRITALARAEP